MVVLHCPEMCTLLPTILTFESAESFTIHHGSVERPIDKGSADVIIKSDPELSSIVPSP